SPSPCRTLVNPGAQLPVPRTPSPVTRRSLVASWSPSLVGARRPAGTRHPASTLPLGQGTRRRGGALAQPGLSRHDPADRAVGAPLRGRGRPPRRCPFAPTEAGLPGKAGASPPICRRAVNLLSTCPQLPFRMVHATVGVHAPCALLAGARMPRISWTDGSGHSRSQSLTDG